MEYRVCRACENSKRLDTEFYWHKKYGYQKICKDCIKKPRRDYYAVHGDKQRAQKKSVYHADLIASREHRRKRYLKLRAEVLLAYGGRCKCCGERREQFLAIDHVNGDGREEREAHGAGTMFYLYLRRQGFPKDRYRLLCHNCNMSMGLYGHCPHAKERLLTSSAREQARCLRIFSSP